MPIPATRDREPHRRQRVDGESRHDRDAAHVVAQRHTGEQQPRHAPHARSRAQRSRGRHGRDRKRSRPRSRDRRRAECGTACSERALRVASGKRLAPTQQGRRRCRRDQRRDDRGARPSRRSRQTRVFGGAPGRRPKWRATGVKSGHSAADPAARDRRCRRINAAKCAICARRRRCRCRLQFLLFIIIDLQGRAGGRRPQYNACATERSHAVSPPLFCCFGTTRAETCQTPFCLRLANRFARFGTMGRNFSTDLRRFRWQAQKA